MNQKAASSDVIGGLYERLTTLTQSPTNVSSSAFEKSLNF